MVLVGGTKGIGICEEQKPKEIENKKRVKAGATQRSTAVQRVRQQSEELTLTKAKMRKRSRAEEDGNEAHG